MRTGVSMNGGGILLPTLYNTGGAPRDNYAIIINNIYIHVRVVPRANLLHCRNQCSVRVVDRQQRLAPS